MRLAVALVLFVFALPAEAQTDPRTEAREHFERGTDLFNEGRYDAALAEFQRAYEIAPALPVLYNLARVHAELGHPVDATHAYERYLAEGGTALPAARRTEVEHALAQQRDRIGRLHVESNVPGAIISVDGRDVATLPLPAPLELGSGTHVIGAHAPGYEGVTREISVAGTVETTVVLELRREIEPRGTLRVASTLAGVSVRVDGREIGLTPLTSTVPVPVGDHEVSGTRAGYLADTHRVHVDELAEVDVTLRLVADPAAPPETMGTLHLALPEASTTIIRVDDEPTLGPDLRLRIGPHRLAIEVTDREPWASEVSIDAGIAMTLAPPLAWTPRERASRIAGGEAQGLAGIGLALTGTVLALVGGPLALWNEVEISSTDHAVVGWNQRYTDAGCRSVANPAVCGPLDTEGRALQQSRDTQDILRMVSWTMFGLGIGLAGIGLTLTATAQHPDRVDAAAHAQLRITPGGLSLTGSF